MPKETVEVMVEGGKVTAAPPVGSTLGPLGVNIGQIVAEANKKTEEFKGIKVPLKITVDTETKSFEIKVGTPPTTALLKQELSIQKASSNSKLEKVGNIAIEQAIKIAKMKKDSLLVKNLKQAVKCIVGTCVTNGILIEGKDPKEVIKEIEQGKYDSLIEKEVTEVSKEKADKLTQELAVIVEELKKKASKQAEKKPKKEAKAEESKTEEKEQEKKPAQGKKEAKAGKKSSSKPSKKK